MGLLEATATNIISMVGVGPFLTIPFMVAAMNGPGLKEQLDELAATLVTPERRTPAYLTGFVKAEWDKWGAAIRAGGAIPK